jgi:hypothetical protein
MAVGAPIDAFELRRRLPLLGVVGGGESGLHSILSEVVIK